MHHNWRIIPFFEVLHELHKPQEVTRHSVTDANVMMTFALSMTSVCEVDT